MKKETIIKRINHAIESEPLLKEASQEQKQKFFNLIYEDFLLFESEEQYTSTQNLDFAIAIWLYEGDQVIKDILNDK